MDSIPLSGIFPVWEVKSPPLKLAKIPDERPVSVSITVSISPFPSLIILTAAVSGRSFLKFEFILNSLTYMESPATIPFITLPEGLTKAASEDDKEKMVRVSSAAAPKSFL